MWKIITKLNWKLSGPRSKFLGPYFIMCVIFLCIRIISTLINIIPDTFLWYINCFCPQNKKKSLPNVFDFCSNLSANMKRKRSPSPVSRRTSRSPLSPRSTRASNRTPPSVKVSPDKNEKMMNGEVNGVNDEEESPSFSIRRSSRARRGSSLHIDYITSPVEVIRDRNRSKEKEVNDTTPTKTRSKIGRSRSSSPDTEEIETPFYGVRFSPSAKPSSPARWQRRSTQRASAKIASMRLQNVPSEDEQSGDLIQLLKWMIIFLIYLPNFIVK